MPQISWDNVPSMMMKAKLSVTLRNCMTLSLAGLFGCLFAWFETKVEMNKQRALPISLFMFPSKKFSLVGMYTGFPQKLN